MTLKFQASELGKIHTRLFEYCKAGNSYILSITRAKDKRSLPQNRYYWGVIVTLFSQETGYTRAEAHQILADKFLRYEKKGRGFTRSTTELDTAEAEKYFEECRLMMWHEFNLHVPLPNELTEDFLVHMENIYQY